MKTLLIATKQERILVADKPLSQGGQIRELYPEQFKEEFGCEYGEGIWLDDTVSPSALTQFQENIESNTSPDNLRRQIKTFLENPPQNLVICKIDDKVGHGVFTTTDIPENTVIAIYSGIITPNQQHPKFKGLARSYHGTNFSYWPGQYRGIASWIQHAPRELRFPNVKSLQSILKMTGQDISEELLRLDDELYSIVFHSPQDRKQLATANTRSEYIIYNGVPVITEVTTSKIKAYEQILTKYGFMLWRVHKQVPELFYETGTIIPHEKYQRTFGSLFFRDFTYTGDLTTLLPKIHQTQAVTFDIGGKNFSVSPSELKQELIRVNALPKNNMSQPLPEKPASTTSSIPLFTTYKTKDLGQALRRASAKKGPEAIISLLQQENIDINAQDKNPNKGYTALHIACQEECIENAKCLLDHHARYDIADCKKDTAIDCMIRKMQNALLNHIADTIILKKYKTDDRHKALRISADKGEVEDLKVLLHLSLDINKAGPETQQTALHRAVIKGHQKCIQLLLKAGANPFEIDKHHRNPAAYAKSIEVLKLFLQVEISHDKTLSEKLVEKITRTIGKLDAPYIIKILELLNAAKDISFDDSHIRIPARCIQDTLVLQKLLADLSKTDRTYEITIRDERIMIATNTYKTSLTANFPFHQSTNKANWDPEKSNSLLKKLSDELELKQRFK